MDALNKRGRKSASGALPADSDSRTVDASGCSIFLDPVPGLLTVIQWCRKGMFRSKRILGGDDHNVVLKCRLEAAVVVLDCRTDYRPTAVDPEQGCTRTATLRRLHAKTTGCSEGDLFQSRPLWELHSGKD